MSLGVVHLFTLIITRFLGPIPSRYKFWTKKILYLLTCYKISHPPLEMNDPFANFCLICFIFTIILFSSDYTREEMSARVFKLYKDFLLSPLAQEYTVNTLIKQRELNRQLQRGNPLANSSPSFIQISNTPNAQQVSINSQGFPPNQICRHINFLYFFLLN